MNKPCLAAVGLLALSAVAASAAEDAAVAATRAVARTQIWKAMTAGRAGSAAVAVMENGAIVYAEGFGMADREKGEPVGQDTVFNIASISKLYAATAIMLLVDDGKVKLDDPVTTHLPEFTMSDERFKAITIRMLLNHASGLPGTVGFDTSGFKHNAGYNRDTLDILARSRLKHRPGEANLYCNDGFTLAEMIVAKVSKMSYMDFLGQRIFTPLALKHTGMSVGAQPEKDADVARVYTPEGRVLPFEAVSPLGAGGLSATAADLCRFADSFTSGGRHILSDASLAEMRKVQPADISGRLKNPLFPYGLGSDFAEIHELKAQGIDVIGKSGGSSGYNSMLFVAPDQRIAVAVVQTGGTGNSMEIAYKLLKIHLAAKGLITDVPAPVAAPPKPEPIPAGLAPHEGYYTDGQKLLRLSIDLPAEKLTVYGVVAGRETKAFEATYSGGYFYGTGGQYSFTAVNGKSYFVRYLPFFNIDSILYGKIEPDPAPHKLAPDIDGRRWLRRNFSAYTMPGKEVNPDSGLLPSLLDSRQIPGLPGSIFFGGVLKIIGPTTAGYPAAFLRDLSELSLSERDGVARAWYSGLLFSDAAAVNVLAGDAASLHIGKEAYNEWLKIGRDAVLGFTRPAQGRILVFDPAGEVTYDSVLDSGEVFVPAGGLVAVAGDPGDDFTVRAR